MNEVDAARARGLGYGLLADVLAHGVTDSTRAAIAASAPLAELLAAHGDDEIGAQLERALGWAAPPFEGAWLDPDGTIGGEATERLWALFGECGFAPDRRSVDVEHLATALRALAFLAGAEADARADDHGGAVERVRELSRRLLDEHVLRWVPVWAHAVQRADAPFGASLARQVEDLLLLHRSLLPGRPADFELAPFEPILDDPDTGLREIGEWLARPARAGLALTRVDVERLGRGLEVPRGFGERSQLIINLLRSAARFEVFPQTVAALRAELTGQAAALAADRYDAIRGVVEPWRRRLGETDALLAELAERAVEAD